VELAYNGALASLCDDPWYLGGHPEPVLAFDEASLPAQLGAICNDHGRTCEEQLPMLKATATTMKIHHRWQCRLAAARPAR